MKEHDTHEIEVRGDPTQKRSPHVIYVAGIPSTCSEEAISEYFQRFGSIDSVQTFEDRTRTQSGSRTQPKPPIRGFCILTTSSRDTFRSIVGFKSHLFFGRALACREYMVGEELRRRNKQLNDRRVILKQVPKDVSQDELRRTLESIGGEVEMFYVFHPDAEAAAPRRHLTCSVMFKQSRCIDELVSIGSFPGPSGKPIIVRKYLHNPSPRAQFSQRFFAATTSNSPAISKLARHEQAGPPISTSIEEDFEARGARAKRECGASQRSTPKCALSYFHTPAPTSSKYHSYRRLLQSDPTAALCRYTGVRLNLCLRQS